MQNPKGTISLARNETEKWAGYMERALFVIGDSNAGKSTQLRSMFLDRRFGMNGKIPTARKIREVYSLSNERWLYLRLTSPHEAGENLIDFIRKCEAKMKSGQRWNFAGPVQITKTKELGDAVEVVSAFVKHFSPERVRAVVLSPDRDGNPIAREVLAGIAIRLRAISQIEVICCDATSAQGNGLVYADFFDFA